MLAEQRARELNGPEAAERYSCFDFCAIALVALTRTNFLRHLIQSYSNTTQLNFIFKTRIDLMDA